MSTTQFDHIIIGAGTGALSTVFQLLALAAVLGGKARREERSLLVAHPEYIAYRASTPAILAHLPWLDWR